MTIGDIENGYTTQKVVETAMGYATDKSTVGATAGLEMKGLHPRESAEDESLAAVTDLVRAQVVTMSTVMEKQWVKIAAAASPTSLLSSQS